jgi:hypothetical protein
MVSSSDSRANQRGREPTTEVTGADAQLTVTEVVGKSFIFFTTRKGRTGKTVTIRLHSEKQKLLEPLSTGDHRSTTKCTVQNTAIMPLVFTILKDNVKEKTQRAK